MIVFDGSLSNDQRPNKAECGGRAEPEQVPSSWSRGEALPSHCLFSHNLYTSLALHITYHVIFHFPRQECCQLPRQV